MAEGREQDDRERTGIDVDDAMLGKSDEEFDDMDEVDDEQEDDEQEEDIDEK